jgi:hypothetical protein
MLKILIRVLKKAVLPPAPKVRLYYFLIFNKLQLV